MKNIPVVILCGGYGTRLGPETENIPKPMIPIGGKPILWHIMRIYAHYGYRDFILALGYKSEVVKNYFLNFNEYHDDVEINLKTGKKQCLAKCEVLDWNITLAETGPNTLKGGRIKRVEKYVNADTFMLTYGDGVANIDLCKLLAFHSRHHKCGTITGVNPPSRFGELIVKGQSVVSFSEKPQVSAGLINGGFFVFNRSLFDHLTPDVNCDFESGPLEVLAKEGQLRVYHHRGSWECMDTVRDMNHLNKLWSEGKAFWKVWKD